jgi:hypothetical protein
MYANGSKSAIVLQPRPPAVTIASSSSLNTSSCRRGQATGRRRCLGQDVAAQGGGDEDRLREANERHGSWSGALLLK